MVIFFWIRELLGLLCSSGFPRVYSSFYSSHLVPPFILAVAVICSFAHSGCFVMLDRKNSFEHCPLPRPAGTTSTIFFSSTVRAVLSTVRHLAKLARLPPSFLSTLTFRQSGGRGGSSDADDLRSWIRKAWSLSYAVFVSCSLVRGIGFLSTSSRTPPTLQSPPVRGRPGGFDGNGGRSSPVVVTSPSVYGSLGKCLGCFNMLSRSCCSSLPSAYTAFYCGVGSSLTGRQRGFVRSLRRTQSTPFELCCPVTRSRDGFALRLKRRTLDSPYSVWLSFPVVPFLVAIFIIPSGCVPRRRTFCSLARVPLSVVSFSSSFASLMFVSLFYFPLVFVSPWFCWFHGFVRFPGFPVSREFRNSSPV